MNMLDKYKYMIWWNMKSLDATISPRRCDGSKFSLSMSLVIFLSLIWNEQKMNLKCSKRCFKVGKLFWDGMGFHLQVTERWWDGHLKGAAQYAHWCYRWEYRHTLLDSWCRRLKSYRLVASMSILIGRAQFAICRARIQSVPSLANRGYTLNSL